MDRARSACIFSSSRLGLGFYSSRPATIGRGVSLQITALGKHGSAKETGGRTALSTCSSRCTILKARTHRRRACLAGESASQAGAEPASGLKARLRRSGDVARRKRFRGSNVVSPSHLLINRLKSRGFRPIDRGGCVLPVGETPDRSRDHPLNTSIRLAYRVMAAMKTRL